MIWIRRKRKRAEKKRGKRKKKFRTREMRENMCLEELKLMKRAVIPLNQFMSLCA